MSGEPVAYETGRMAALVVYGLYLLSIPSAALFALVGVIVAYVALPGADPVGAAHLRDQIRVWWIAFWWGVALFVAAIPAWILAFVIIGIPLLWLIGIVGFIVMVWFTVKAVLGLLQLLNGARP